MNDFFIIHHHCLYLACISYRKRDAISDFKDHPFHINLDEDMVKLIESIEVNGQLMPVLVRPSKNGYEMISGHRRKYAMQKLGYQKVKAIVLDCVTNGVF